MKIIYKCVRQFPSDIEKKHIEKILKDNMALMATYEGEGTILPHQNGAIFFNKEGSCIEVVDFIFTTKIIEIT